MRVLVYYQKGNKRSQAVTTALQAGIARCQGNDSVLMVDESTYTTPLPADVVCFYGLAGNFMKLFRDYRKKGVPTVFFDLGYWGRKGDPQPDFHRVAVNGYQPTPYFTFDATPERFAIFRKEIKPWKTDGEEILVAGMSERASQVWGLGDSTAHAAAIIAEIRKYTDRPICYRPKPSCPQARPIPGTRYSHGGVLQDDLRRAYCTVSYRSNVAVDGLIEGVPCIILGDHPAKLMSHNDVSRIEDLWRPDDPLRLQFCSSLSWHQYSLGELRSGYGWKELKKHGWL